jgi:hypothetical protein
MTQRGTITRVYEFTENGMDPSSTFTLEADYIYTPGQPDKLWPWPGEPGYGPEVEINARFVHATRTLTQAESDFLLSCIDLAELREHIIEEVTDR